MSRSASTPDPPFDEYAESYDRALAEGLSVSGEDKTYFARGRMTWLARCLAGLQASPRRVLDFGCGTGSSVPLLLDLHGAVTVLGVDVSARSLSVARREVPSERARFATLREYQPAGDMDLAFCNGVFHHVPPAERPGAVDCVYRSLQPGGIFSFWENNPWNPGTRYVMSRIPFDRDAQTLTPPEARRMLRAGGLEILRTDFLFIFPRALKWLRFLEPGVARLPFGAQYQILARRPGAPAR